MIEEVTIDGFKSLRNCRIDFEEKTTCLVGLNGGGKEHRASGAGLFVRLDGQPRDGLACRASVDGKRSQDAAARKREGNNGHHLRDGRAHFNGLRGSLAGAVQHVDATLHGGGGDGRPRRTVADVDAPHGRTDFLVGSLCGTGDATLRGFNLYL